MPGFWIVEYQLVFYLEVLVEYRVFIKFYSRLSTVFHNKDYLPHLVAARVVSPDSIRHLSSLSNRDRAVRLLACISDSFEGGEKGCFYGMLKVMQEHGNLHAQNVAKEINKAIVSGVDSTGMCICTCMYVCMYVYTVLPRSTAGLVYMPGLV